MSKFLTWPFKFSQQPVDHLLKTEVAIHNTKNIAGDITVSKHQYVCFDGKLSPLFKNIH